MRGVLLDKYGHPEHTDMPSKGLIHSWMTPDVDEERMLHSAPEHVQKNLQKASEDKAFHPRASMQAWQEVLYAPLADGATATAAAEALMFPIFTLPANYLYPGRLMKWTIMGRQSSAITTPGTFTMRLSYSATGLGAVAVAASSAFAPDPTAAATNLTFMVQWWMICRSVGTSGTAMGWGKTEWTDYDDATLATLVANMGMDMAPASAPANATIDTTVARALSPTYQPSLTTASMTAHAGFLEAKT